jgi:hypothetical protein
MYFLSYLNMYVEHPNGNYGLYGLNTIGCDSIILFKGEILKFYALKTGTNVAIYTNEKGEQVIVDVYDKSLKITRMMWIDTKWPINC